MRLIAPCLLAAALAGCATTENGRTQWVAPPEIGAVYSEMDMRARLVLATPRECADDACASTEAFRKQVAAVGADLSAAAYAAYPELSQRIPKFEFAVPSKGEVGTLSNSAGMVVIFEELGAIGLDDAALNFIVAREMGHVIARHHDENAALSIMVSIVVQLVLPVANLVRGAAAAIPMTSAATATTTAASMLGSRILKAANQPDQVDEADAIALNLLRQAGWNLEAVARSVERSVPKLERAGEIAWTRDFMRSKARLDVLDCGESWQLALPEAQPLKVVAAKPEWSAR